MNKMFALKLHITQRYVFLSLLLFVATASWANTFYVSPSGNDNWAGTEKKPFKTVEKAQLAAREQLQKTSSDIVIFVRGGEYFIQKPLRFTAKDGGNANFKVIYKAYPGENPVFMGGKRISAWELYKDGIYKTSVKGLSFRQLYANSKRAIRARQPNVGDYYRLSGWDLKNRKLMMNSNYIHEWKNFEKVEAVIQMFWAESYVHLKSFDKNQENANLVDVSINDQQADILFPRPYPQKQDDAVFHLENALEFVDQAGEWYLNPVTEELYYKTSTGEDIHKLEIIAPITETLIFIEGTLNEPVSNLQFEGIVFTYTNWNLPSINGFINAQAGMYNLTANPDNYQTARRPASAIRIQNAKNIVFEANHFQNMGSTAIDLVSGTNTCLINANVIRSIAGNGVMIGAFTAQTDGEYHIPYNPLDKRDICTNDEISNNLITETARDYYGCCAVAAGYPAGLKILHNQIHDAPYCGISLGYGWTPEPNAMHENIVGYNDISNVMNLICDGGGIYTLSMQPGTTIIGNYIHDINRSKWAGEWPIASMYLDEASGGTMERPMVVERNSIPEYDKTVKQWNLHREGIVLLKNNSVYKIDEVVNNAGIEPKYKEIVSKLTKIN